MERRGVTEEGATTDGEERTRPGVRKVWHGGRKVK